MAENAMFIICDVLDDVTKKEVRKQFAVLEQILSCTAEDYWTSRNIWKRIKWIHEKCYKSFWK